MAKILIVEDEAHIARVMGMWLERHGHQALDVADGAAALELIDREEVDLIISDMNMPGLDGVGLVRILREERGMQLPILLVTARCDQAELLEKVRPYNVRLYPKPFVPSRLVADIEDMLSARAV